MATGTIFVDTTTTGAISPKVRPNRKSKDQTPRS